eukprot:gnl/MRDRNA2_/MRDRNA2_90442_c0_seq1.p1 gnl/MRDRNA2_/MRDRNA2_90442_c0~~gnl/MRDRNA2_/MRDRNA2_90442_c0_seq1.p1  ORF type:complete len:200 (-),score=15.83 gnl/MRDRNA2_/MRDRNA2_90442_c0_seq1:118-717(-)
MAGLRWLLPLRFLCGPLVVVSKTLLSRRSPLISQRVQTVADWPQAVPLPSADGDIADLSSLKQFIPCPIFDAGTTFRIAGGTAGSSLYLYCANTTTRIQGSEGEELSCMNGTWSKPLLKCGSNVTLLQDAYNNVPYNRTKHLNKTQLLELEVRRARARLIVSESGGPPGGSVTPLGLVGRGLFALSLVLFLWYCNITPR